MNQEQIIKLTEELKPEGFEISQMGNDSIGYLLSMDICKTISFGFGVIEGHPNTDKQSYEIWKNIYYPLWLTRIIEAINRGRFRIEIKSNILKGVDERWFYTTLECMSTDYSTPDQAKEQAIEYYYREVMKR